MEDALCLLPRPPTTAYLLACGAIKRPILPAMKLQEQSAAPNHNKQYEKQLIKKQTHAKFQHRAHACWLSVRLAADTPASHLPAGAPLHLTKGHRRTAVTTEHFPFVCIKKKTCLPRVIKTRTQLTSARSH